MKRIINASISVLAPITELTEDEISSLPEKVVVMTRTPNHPYSHIFQIVSNKSLRTPHKCFYIPSWGFALGQDVYLASKDIVRECYKEKAEKLREEENKMAKFAVL